MFGLSIIGLIHTLLSFIALGTLVVAFIREGRLGSTHPIGRISLVTTALTALTALALFRHGGPGPGHALAVLTLLAVGAAFFFGRRSSWVPESIAAGTTVLFHLIPGVTEALVRLPTSQPFASSPEDPALRPVYAGVLALTGVVLGLQVRAARRA